MYRVCIRSPRSRPLRRPRRPPDAFSSHNARFFAHNPQLLLVSHSSPRPQLSFLPPSGRSSSRSGQWQLARLLTTEKREYYKEQAWIFGKYSLVGYALATCSAFILYGVVQSVLESEQPTPSEWSFYSRTKFRSAHGNLNPDASAIGVVDWALVGSLYKQVLKRLENPSIDGAGLLEQEEGGIIIPGAGKSGYDLSNKSEAWRAGYCECLMGCAKAAEHLDGMVMDRTTRGVTPAHYMVGPSNPNPKPMPPWRWGDPPLEENCEPAMPPPETFYVQILTTRGFTTKQRLDAAIAYADWLDFKDLPEAAEEVYKWGVDIAMSAVSDATPALDPSTYVVPSASASVSENVLTAATAMATHYAQTSQVSKALPIYLSVLRARRSAPTSSQPLSSENTRSATQLGRSTTDIEAMGRWWRWFVAAINDAPYPLPLTTGDEPFTRSGAQDTHPCEEAKVMTYIGEILFAAASNERGKADAIRWTRDAIEKADQPTQDVRLPVQARLRCLDCVEAGLVNWVKMARRMADAEREKGLAASPPAAASGWGSWLSFGGPAVGSAGIDVQGRWALEESDAEKRLAQFNRKGLREKLTESPLAPLWQKVGWLMQG